MATKLRLKNSLNCDLNHIYVLKVTYFSNLSNIRSLLLCVYKSTNN